MCVPPSTPPPPFYSNPNQLKDNQDTASMQFQSDESFQANGRCGRNYKHKEKPNVYIFSEWSGEEGIYRTFIGWGWGLDDAKSFFCNIWMVPCTSSSLSTIIHLLLSVISQKKSSLYAGSWLFRKILLHFLNDSRTIPTRFEREKYYYLEQTCRIVL